MVSKHLSRGIWDDILQTFPGRQRRQLRVNGQIRQQARHQHP
jgi:hypothetical protein